MEYLREKSALERGQSLYTVPTYIAIADAVIDRQCECVYGNWMFRLSTLYYLSGNAQSAAANAASLAVNILNLCKNARVLMYKKCI